MRTLRKKTAVLAAGFLVGIAAAEKPHIGYVFPAGGQQGDSFTASLGGEHLSLSTNVFVSGEGVTVEIGKYSVNYDPKKFQQFYNKKRNLEGSLVDKKGDALEKTKKQLAEIERQLRLADLPADVDPLNKKEVNAYVRSRTKEQFNPQIAERLKLKISIDKKAPPGERELRVYTPEGLSNPIYFEVGTLEETREVEPNDDHMKPDLQVLPVPSVVNGQIRPGDIDHFRFKAVKGDSLVVDVAARRIIPYLADAVPGWFQAVVALYDEDGNEVAYQDDYKFNPDPVLFFDVPKNGTYTLSVRDAIYRGREDFIYRIAIGELPFITSIFPLGAQQGKDVDIALSGRNLPKTRLTGKLPSGGSEIRHISVKKEGYRSNQMPFAIGDMPETFEAEPNNSPAEAQPIQEPLLVNGRISKPGDRDVFSFQGSKGDSVSIEVIARRLNSPLDSVLTLTGPGLDKPVRNDDNVNRDKTFLNLGEGLLTHYADSYLLQELPGTGTYFVEVADTQSHGGHDYCYRLRVSPSKPDFTLRMEPSGMNIAPGGTAAFLVRAMRQDGFSGQISLNVNTLPSGFSMSKSSIPKGAEITRLTITAPREIEGKLVTPEITGMGIINGSPVTHTAVPVDDQMQAFLYRHLVPAQELVLAPVSQKPPLIFEARIPKSGIIELPAGQETRIIVNGHIFAKRNGFTLSLDQPPEGFSMSKGWVGKQKMKGKGTAGKARFDKTRAAGSMLISVDESVKPGTRASLVVVAEVRKGKEKEYYSAPAIPVKVVKPRGP